MNIQTLIVPLFILLAFQVQASETLQLKILTATGEEYQVEQRLQKIDEAFTSGVLGKEDAQREYQAIRCDGPWGAEKYMLALPSGPGYQLELGPETILLRIVEYAVIDEDRTIEAMTIHCRDTEPRRVLRSVVEIQLDRGSQDSQEMELPNGYRLLYSYRPTAAADE